MKAPWDELSRAERFLGLKPEITRDRFVFVPEKGFYCVKDPATGEPDCMRDSKGTTEKPEVNNKNML